MRILAVDDDPIFLTVLDALLSSLRKCEVETAPSAEAALREIAIQEFDLVISDLNMPDVDGLAFLRRLSEAGYGGPVLVVTGEKDIIRSSARHIAEGLGLQIIGALKKPLIASDLEEMLRRAEAKPAPARSDVSADTASDFVPILHYQPQFDMLTRRIFGAEALLRGELPNGDVIGTDAVLQRHATPAERFELAVELFSALCADFQQLEASGLPIRLSFNVDAGVLERPEFVPLVLEAARSGRLDPARVTIELTERQLPSDSLSLLEKLARLGIAGFEIAMDDFGTGASNYEFLRRGAFSEIKIDHGVISQVESDPMSARFVGYSVSLANDAGTRLIAEGVETAATALYLFKHGVRYAQGYYFGRPVPLRDLLSAVRREKPVKLVV